MTTIDVHAHYFPEEYAAFIEPLGLGGRMYRSKDEVAPAAPYRFPPENVARRLDAMNEAGVTRQILSIIAAPYLPENKPATEAARLGNDLYAAFCRRNPDRFSFWASLPLPHVDSSIAELRRAVDQLDAVGVTMQCFCLNQTIARSEFAPLYAELNRRHAVVFLHPCQNALCSPLIGDFGLTVCAGASMEDAVVAMHLIVEQIPIRYPNIRFIVPHFGGLLPMLLNRLDGQMSSAGFAERPSVTARRFFYDTVGWGSKAALLAAVTAFGPDQLLPGSDWPVLLPWESYTQTFDHIRLSGLPRDAIDTIMNLNVQRLLGERMQGSAANAWHTRST